MAPKLLKTLEAEATIDGEVGANIAATAIESALPSDQGKQMATLFKEAISGTSKSIGEAATTTSESNREAINKT